MQTCQYITTMHITFRHVIVIFAILITGSYSALTQRPEAATLQPNDSLRLNCRSNVTGTPLLWAFMKQGSTTEQIMTDGGNLKKDFSNLFAINSSSPYDLIATMTNDTAPYCGTYECQEFDGGHNAEKATASVATVTSPTCVISPQSATGDQAVSVSCSVTVCGNASVSMRIMRDGRGVGSGTNTATWETTADNVMSSEYVTCSVNFGDNVRCPNITTTFTSLASSTDLPALSVYSFLAFMALRMSM